MIHESIVVTYKGLTFNVYVDGAGLDIEATDDASLADIMKNDRSVSHELFCKVFDYGYSNGLALALMDAGAELHSKVGA